MLSNVSLNGHLADTDSDVVPATHAHKSGGLKLSGAARGTPTAIVFLLLALASGAALAAHDNDATCPVVANKEDLVELWAMTPYSRGDMNGAVTDCAEAVSDTSLFQGDGVPDVVQMAMIQASIESGVSLGGTTAEAMYQASADALCQDVSYLWSEVNSAFAMMSADSQDFVQCVVMGVSTGFTGVPILADMLDNPTSGFAYFGAPGDFDGDGVDNLTEWTSALATVGISSTDVSTYDDAAWGLVWENARRGGPGGPTALQAFLASNGLSLPHSLDFFPLPEAAAAPPPTPAGQLRLVSWNIECLGTRTPPRTVQQHQELAGRMFGFDAAVFCLQEINYKPVLAWVIGMMGPSYQGVYWWNSDNAIVYDQNKVVLVESELLDFLTDPPYSTYAADYPGATTFPFIPPARIPVTAVFRPVGGTQMFRVISFHGHWFSLLCRQYEGNALNRYVSELLATEDETPNIFVIGDFNGCPDYSPESELETDGILVPVPSENGEVTQHTMYSRIDHVSATPGAMARIPDSSLYVVRPRLYGEMGEDFHDTYSDHFPLLVEINAAEGAQMPIQWWPALLALLVVGTVCAVLLSGALGVNRSS